MIEIIAFSSVLAALSVLTLIGFELWDRYSSGSWIDELEDSEYKPELESYNNLDAALFSLGIIKPKPTGIDSWSPLTLKDPNDGFDKLRFKTNHLLSLKTKPRKKSKKTKKR